MSILVWLTFLPLLGALLIALVPGSQTAALRGLALATTLAAAVLGVFVWGTFQSDGRSLSMVVDTLWFRLPVSQIPVHFKLGLDGLSFLMAVFTTVLMPLVVLSTFGHIEKRVKEFMIWLLCMQTGMLGVFLAQDLVLFYFFWEISLIPLFFIIGIWGGKNRLYATLKFFLYTLAGSLVMLVGVVWMIYALSSSDMERLAGMSSALPDATQAWLFFAFALAFAIKVPVLPFHTWLADAHTEAPTSGSVLLAGVLLKMGTYGLLRFCIGMFPEAAVTYGPWFMALGAIGIVYGAFLAMAQNDLKRLVACSSVSHLGYVVLGLFALTQAGLRGGLLQMVNHGISTGLLFLLVGAIYERRHTRMLDQFGGIAKSMPIFATCFVIAVLSSVGLPGLNGFVGEWLILLGSFQAAPIWTAVGVTGVIFGAVYLLSATRKVLFGAIVHAENRQLNDLNGRELLTMAPLFVLVVWIGVAPNYFLGKSLPTLDALQDRLDAARRVQTAELEAQTAVEIDR